MARNRRRVSRATREKIAKALRRYWREIHRRAARAVAAAQRKSGGGFTTLGRRRRRAALKGWATRRRREREAEEARILRVQRRRQREAERAREQFGDFEDYEIEIAVDYVPAGRR